MLCNISRMNFVKQNLINSFSLINLFIDLDNGFFHRTTTEERRPLRAILCHAHCFSEVCKRYGF